MVRANVDAAVESALATSQEGGLPTRLVRYVTGGEVDKPVSAEFSYSQAGDQPLRPPRRRRRSIAKPENATVSPTADSLEVVAGKDGRKLRDDLLTEELRQRGPQRRRPAYDRRRASTRPSRR